MPKLTNKRFEAKFPTPWNRVKRDREACPPGVARLLCGIGTRRVGVTSSRHGRGRTDAAEHVARAPPAGCRPGA